MLALLLETLARHIRLGALAVAIAVVGAGGATAAMVTVADSADTVSVPVRTAAVTFDQDACDAARNHGAYVSFVAHATKGLADRSTLVSAAAQSDCGKKDATEKLAAKAAKVKTARVAKVKPSKG